MASVLDYSEYPEYRTVLALTPCMTCLCGQQRVEHCDLDGQARDGRAELRVLALHSRGAVQQPWPLPSNSRPTDALRRVSPRVPAAVCAVSYARTPRRHTRYVRACRAYLPRMPRVPTACAARTYRVCHAYLPRMPRVPTACATRTYRVCRGIPRRPAVHRKGRKRARARARASVRVTAACVVSMASRFSTWMRISLCAGIAAVETSASVPINVR
jgi:hypothetical protein